METITNRLQTATADERHEEEQADFLDEEEQERLLQDLRRQNEQSNLMIQAGLLFIGVLVSAIFIVYFYELSSTATLPFPFLSTPVVSRVKYPRLGVLLSIGSIGVSILNLMLTCRVTLSDFMHMTPSHRGVGRIHFKTANAAVTTGLMIPVTCFRHSYITWVEVAFWCLPLMVFVMNVLAITMMGQVEASFTELDKSRYKYKGA